MSGPATGEYTAPGKRAVRQLLLDLARATDVRTFGTLWGHGVDSRMFAPYFDVVACEVKEAKHEAMVADGLANGYRTFTRRAGLLTESVDMFHADFDGTASPGNFDELERIAKRTRRWLAVTLSNDHKLNPSLQGRAAFHTIPAWLTGASGFTLEYLTTYRSTGGQTMWFAILQRRSGRGHSHAVHPVQISYSVTIRGYWASRNMYRSGHMKHRREPESPDERAQARIYYDANRDRYLDHSRRRYRADPKGAYERHREWVANNRARMQELNRQNYARVKSDPERWAKRQAYAKAWYLRKKAAVSGTAAEAVFSEEAA